VTATSPKRPTSPAKLTRAEDTAASFPGLDSIADRGANALSDMLEALGCRGAIIARGEAELVSASTWRARSKSSALCHFESRPFKGSFTLMLDANLIMRLVDIFYGGDGQADPFSGAFRAADDRMIARVGEHMTALLPSVWRDVAPMAPQLLLSGEAHLAMRGAKLILHPFVVSGLGPEPLSVSWGYPIDFLRQLPSLSNNGGQHVAVAPDPQWQNQMRRAVSEISLPVRTIFARPEVPLSQLLVLKPGDIIPVCLPSTVPVTVAGRVFAEASVGEAGGRTAIKIARIAEGSPIHD
jgi:flagellar motor switch protein FliM